jgi:hypothetical protein
VSALWRKILKVFPYAAIAILYLTVALWVTSNATALDYGAYLIGAHGFVTGQDVYRWSEADFKTAAQHLNIPYFAYPYRYSPLVALLISPLLAFPYRTGLLIWCLVNAAAVVTTGELLSRLSADNIKRWVIRLAVWLFVPFLTSIYAGQANPLTTLLATLAVLAFREDRERLAGGWAALAFLMKPIVLGLICYPIWKGRWKAVISCGVIMAMIFSLLTILFGWGGLKAGIPFTNALSTRGVYPPLQNLMSAARRLLSTHDYGWSLANNPVLSDWVGVSLCIILAMATMAFCWPPLLRGSWRETGLGLTIIAFVVIVPATWYHHFTILTIPLAILLASAQTRIDIAFAAISWVAINIFGLAWHHLTGHTLLLDIGTAGALVLWIGLVVNGFRKRTGGIIP